MKVKDLIRKLKDCDPESLVVLSGSDHSYYPISGAMELFAVKWKKYYSEYFERAIRQENEEIVTVCLIE